MKWLLIVMVLGTTPVKTDLIFDTIDQCLTAEDTMRAEYSRAYNAWLEWAAQNRSKSGYPRSADFMGKRIGLNNFGTCIPHP